MCIMHKFNIKRFVILLLFGLTLNYNSALAASSSEINEWLIKGYNLDTGTGVSKNPKEAAKWYLKAAEAGEPNAQRNLAGMYGSGRGVKKDNKLAKKWFLLAAEAGDAQAQYAYGRWYAKDKTQSKLWLFKAKEQGHKDATAYIKERGFKQEKNQVKSVQSLKNGSDPKDTSGAQPIGYEKEFDNWSMRVGGKPENKICDVVSWPLNFGEEKSNEENNAALLIRNSNDYPNSSLLFAGGLFSANTQFVVIDGIRFPFIPYTHLRAAVISTRTKTLSDPKKDAAFGQESIRIAQKSLLLAMQHGRILMTTGTYEKTGKFNDIYSLIGFTQAKVAADAACSDRFETALRAKVEAMGIAKSSLQCVQMQLNSLSYNAGKPDGLMGRKTRGAAENYLSNNSLELGKLDKKSALEWCKALTKAHPLLSPISTKILENKGE